MSKKIMFDIDGCLCTQTPGDYENAQPIAEAITVVNRLFDDGFTILLYTARYMGRHQGDVEKAYDDGYELTRRQLFDWGVRYHELKLGKPSFDLMVDDRAVFFRPDWQAIEGEIRERLGA